MTDRLEALTCNPIEAMLRTVMNERADLRSRAPIDKKRASYGAPKRQAGDDEGQGSFDVICAIDQREAQAQAA